MARRWSFFRHGDTSFGLFYPQDYSLAAFDTMERALAAEAALRDVGFPADEVRAVSGEFVGGRLEHPDDVGLLDRLKVKLARVLGTEESHIEKDLAHARDGGAFLFAYTPDNDTTERFRDVLLRHNVEYARRYLPHAIEPLAMHRAAATAATAAPPGRKRAVATVRGSWGAS